MVQALTAKGARMVRSYSLTPDGEYYEPEVLFPIAGRGYSWSNPSTAKYLAQKYPLPDRALPSADADLIDISGAIEHGVRSITAGVCEGLEGWAHPIGGDHSGVTGGGGINPTAYVDSLDGLMLSQARMRMGADRMGVAMYQEDGRPRATGRRTRRCSWCTRSRG